MGQGALLAAAALIARPVPSVLLGLLASAGSARAAPQGPAYRDSWGYLHLEARRAEVLRELAGRDAATEDAVAQLLRAPTEGLPFRPVARALARLRGVAGDPAFELRTTIGVFVLPEVVDPDGANEVCRAANVSVSLPFALALPGALTFAVTVRAADDDVVWSGTIERDVDEHALRNAKASAQVPCAELADGAYRVECTTLVDGVPPRASDPRCVWTFHVLRGYQARAEAALAAARARADLPGGPAAWLGGAAAAVQRAYGGEPWAVVSDGVRELERLERVLANLEAGRAVGDGLPGDAALAVQAGTGPPLHCVLRRAAGVRATGPRPLVVIAAATPAYDVELARPLAPPTRDPRWLAHQLNGFGELAGWHVAFVESPGVGRDYGPSLREALPRLAELAGEVAGKPVLVCEREAAAVVGLQLAQFAPLLRALVLVGGGTIAGPALLAHGALPIRVAAARGSGEESLQRLVDFAAQKRADGSWSGDLAWLSPRRPPWTCALPLLAPELDAFVRRCFAD
jgi:hypothetical protein